MKKMGLVAMIDEGEGPWMRPGGSEKCARVSNLGDAKVFLDVNIGDMQSITAYPLVEGDNDLTIIIDVNVIRYRVVKESGDEDQLATTVEIIL